MVEKTMSQKLSIVMPSCNDAFNTQKTVENILVTCGNRNNIEIIVVNDGSNEDYSKLSANPSIKYIENNENIGTSKSRDVGIKEASSECILTTDSHVVFLKKGWDNEIVEIIKSNNNSIGCFPCVDVANNMAYCAGGFHLFNIKNKDLSLSPFLLNNEPTEREIPCVVGGAYAFNKNWHKHLHGMEGMVGWGVGETFLSIKSYLAGGNCKLFKHIKVGHKFEKAKYTINKRDLYYNKIFLSQTIFPPAISTMLLNLLPNGVEKAEALELFKLNFKEIFKTRVVYEDILTVPFAEYVNKFKLGQK
jgi:glycosyltransferase involved in cell wall biosynthesis